LGEDDDEGEQKEFKEVELMKPNSNVNLQRTVSLFQP